MPMSETDKIDVLRQFARRVYGELGATADLNTANLKAAIDSIDDTFNSLASTLTQGQTVEINFNANFPEPFKSTATVPQKALALAYWAMKRGGLI